MYIAICDDDSFFRNELKNILLHYQKQHRISLFIVEFASGEKLLNTNLDFDIIFLDYKMRNLNGLETAKLIKKGNALSSIIFVTAYPHFVFDSFEVQPFRFLVKPIKKDKIFSVLDDFLVKQKLLYPILVIADGKQKSINSYDIIYIEGDGKYSIIVTTKGDFHTAKTLSKIQEVLPEHCFYRTHKSYLINMYFVSEFSSDKIKLSNNHIAMLSKARSKSFKNDYMNFIKISYLKV